jgi:phage tail sheath gpL-like
MFLKIQLSVDETTEQLNEFLRLDTTDYDGSFGRLLSYLEMIKAKARHAYVKVQRAAVRATGTVTFTGAPTAADTVTINGVAFTARASGAVANEFNIGGTVTLTAAALAAAINASVTAKIAGYVTATSLAGVVTVTATEPGLAGNVFTITESMDNTTVVTFANGSEGTEKVLFMGKTSV